MGLNLTEKNNFGRLMRQDPIEDLGISSFDILRELIRAGKTEDALRMVDYVQIEGKGLHDLYCDWSYAFLEWVRQREGEDALKDCLEYCKGITAHTFYNQLKNATTFEELIQFFAEGMRAHRCGPNESGTLRITDDGTKVVMEFDPCGSGGRMRRGSPVDGTPSRLGPPFNLGTTTKKEDWNWYLEEVPLYCLHCDVWHELMPLESGAFPRKFTNYVKDPSRPCSFVFYRNLADVPDVYFHRVGYEKPEKPGMPAKRLSRAEALERLKDRNRGDSI